MSAEVPSKRDWSDLSARIASAFVLGAVCFSMIFFSIGTTAIIAAVGCGIMGWEWSRISGGESTNVAQAMVVAASVVPSIMAFSISPLIAVIGVVVGAVLVVLVSIDKAKAVKQSAPGIVVIALTGICFVWLRSDAQFGLHVALWLPFTVIAADVGAYFAGRFVGGPKLAPRISPNKTISGAVGGQIAAVIVGTGYAAAFGLASIGTLVILSFLTAIVSQLGDLTESALKRGYGVKDTSALIPGHGGLLDRFDGLIAAILFVALVTLLAGSTIFAW